MNIWACIVNDLSWKNRKIVLGDGFVGRERTDSEKRKDSQIGLVSSRAVGRGAFGYRVVEGGADVDEVYNFAWFNYAVVSGSYRWGRR